MQALILMMLGILLAPLCARAQDPNDYNPCGQYNSYMGDLCAFDKEHDKKVQNSGPLACTDCHATPVLLRDDTRYRSSGEAPPGGSQRGSPEGTD